ncbi:MAG: hypothetical protein HYV40_06375 [Candidatus Levybacteria bacterium]|nr:hypothetical protein [Candidatus Levybacteria bacterium]
MDKKLIYLFAGIIYFLAAVYITYPLILHLGSIATSLRDELLISWIQVTVVENLFANPLQLFSGNIFYPYTNVLAYSDLHLTSALLSFVPAFLTGQAITAINMTFFSSLVLLGFAAFILSYHLTRNFSLSILSGLLIQFSPATLDKNVHVQILAIEWVLFSILFFLLSLQKKSFSYFLLSLLFFLLQTLNSFLPGYFIVVSYIVIASIFVMERRKKVSYYFQRKHVVAFFLSLCIIGLVAFPYYKVSRQFSYVRDIREVVHLSLQPEDLLYPNDLTRLQPLLLFLSNQTVETQEASFKVGYIGLVFSLLSVITFWYVLKHIKKVPAELLALFIIAIIGLVLSFGPALHLGRKTVHWPSLIPLPYAILYYVVPGFQGIRSAYRWEMLFVLCMSVSSIMVLQKLLKRLQKNMQLIIPLLLSVFVIAEFNYPIQFVSVPQVSSFPPVYSYIRSLPSEATIVEMPIYNWNMAPYSTRELERVYFSTYHGKKMLNGASGFSPPPWQEDVTELLRTFPSRKSIVRLKRLEIRYIVLHAAEYDRLNKDKFMVSGTNIRSGNSILDSLQQERAVKRMNRFGDDYIFKIL